MQKPTAKKKNETIAIRTKKVQSLGMAFPPTAQIILDWTRAERPNAEIFSFAVPMLPPTVNHMYRQGQRGKRYLTDEALQFRAEVSAALMGKKWKLKGLLLAIIFYESPHWISKKNEVRVMDTDNRQKALFDAFRLASGVDDSRVWEYHAYKITGPKTQTSFFALDLGDIVEFYK